MFDLAKRLVKRAFRRRLLERRVARHRAALGAASEFRVIFGRHWAEIPGWLILSQEEQDITRPLEFASGSVDVVFTEHVLEHVRFLEGVGFVRESLRVLRPGGIFRAVCPMTEKILSFSAESGRDREYLRCLDRFYPEEKDLFSGLGFDGFGEFGKVFLINSIFTGYGHRFIWSAALMERVLLAIGFSSATIYEVGKGRSPEYCLERRRRGLYLGNDPAEDSAPGWVYDAESLAVEAVK